jgi:hypothetical protein
MSGSVCALGHPLTESQQLCAVCGLGRLPETPAVPAELQYAATPAPATQWAPPPLQSPPPPPVPSQQWSPYQPAGLGGSAVYPSDPFAAPKPRRSRQWIVISAVAAVAVLAGGAVWWTQRPEPSATGTLQADGTTVVDSRGIHIVTPAGWTVVSTTPAALAKAGKTLAQSNPQLSSALQGLESRQQRNILRFFAYDKPAADGSISDADVLVSNTVLPLGAVVDGNSANLSQTGAVNVHESPIAGEANAEELTYQLPLTLSQGRSVTFHVDQVYVSKGSEVGILTLGTTAPKDATFATMINSFHLT